MLNTTNYDMFKLLEINREKGVDYKHVHKLVDSIRSNNMLEFRPIECNENMEVIDGQHRLAAAKIIGCPVYYTVNKKFKKSDMISLNIVKAWTTRDFLNYYVKEGYPEYIKLNEFVKKNSLDVRIAIKLSKGRSTKVSSDFKMGLYTFDEQDNSEFYDICWQTIDYIKKVNGISFCAYTSTSRFWNSLAKLVRHAGFDKDKWFSNLTRMIERFDIRACERDYLKLFMDVHNWHNHKKIDLLDDDY